MKGDKFQLDLIFLDNQQLAELIPFVKISAKKYSENYKSYIITVQYIFVILSVAFFILFTRRIKHQPSDFKINIEQKNLITLGLVLIAFNDPLSCLNFKYEFFWYPILSSLQKSIFLWLMIADIYNCHEKDKEFDKGNKNSLICGLLVFFWNIYSAYGYIIDPTLSVNVIGEVMTYSKVYYVFYYSICTLVTYFLMKIFVPIFEIVSGTFNFDDNRMYSYVKIQPLEVIFIVLSVYKGWFDYYSRYSGDFIQVKFLFNMLIYFRYYIYLPEKYIKMPTFEETTQSDAGKRNKKLRSRNKKRDGAMELANTSIADVNDSLEMRTNGIRDNQLFVDLENENEEIDLDIQPVNVNNNIDMELEIVQNGQQVDIGQRGHDYELERDDRLNLEEIDILQNNEGILDAPVAVGRQNFNDNNQMEDWDNDEGEEEGEEEQYEFYGQNRNVENPQPVRERQNIRDQRDSSDDSDAGCGF